MPFTPRKQQQLIDQAVHQALSSHAELDKVDHELFKEENLTNSLIISQKETGEDDDEHAQPGCFSNCGAAKPPRMIYQTTPWKKLEQNKRSLYPFSWIPSGESKLLCQENHAMVRIEPKIARGLKMATYCSLCTGTIYGNQIHFKCEHKSCIDVKTCFRCYNSYQLSTLCSPTMLSPTKKKQKQKQQQKQNHQKDLQVNDVKKVEDIEDEEADQKNSTQVTVLENARFAMEKKMNEIAIDLDTAFSEDEELRNKNKKMAIFVHQERIRYESEGSDRESIDQTKETMEKTSETNALDSLDAIEDAIDAKEKIKERKKQTIIEQKNKIKQQKRQAIIEKAQKDAEVVAEEEHHMGKKKYEKGSSKKQLLGKYSEGDIKAALHTLFSKFAITESGHLNPLELKLMMTEIDTRMHNRNSPHVMVEEFTMNEIKQVIGIFDEDGNGLIEEQELLNWLLEGTKQTETHRANFAQMSKLAGKLSVFLEAFIETVGDWHDKHTKDEWVPYRQVVL